MQASKKNKVGGRTLPGLALTTKPTVITQGGTGAGVNICVSGIGLRAQK